MGLIVRRVDLSCSSIVYKGRALTNNFWRAKSCLLKRDPCKLWLIRDSVWFIFALLLRMMVNVQVPASTTNLGPGFDCLGTSLQLWNWIKIEPDHNQIGRASCRERV